MDKMSSFKFSKEEVNKAVTEHLDHTLARMGFNKINRKYLMGVMNNVNKVRVGRSTYSVEEAQIISEQLRTSFSQVCSSCEHTGTVGVIQLKRADTDYFGEAFKESLTSCVEDKSLVVALEMVANSWYKLRYSGEVMDLLYQVLVWYGRVFDNNTSYSLEDVVSVFYARLYDLSDALQKCGVKVI